MITIERAFCVHEEGTKFYQIYTITSDVPTAPAFSVNHWGAYSTGADITPASHGQNTPFPANRNRESRERTSKMIASKKKRGYTDWKVSVQQCNTEEAFNDAVKGIFNGGSSEILHHMQKAIEMDDDFHSGAKKAKKVSAPETPIDRGPLWGEW